jgi:hypothetical protein
MKQIGTPMRLAATIDIFDYWNKIRGAEIAPLRSQIEPNDGTPYPGQSLHA